MAIRKLYEFSINNSIYRLVEGTALQTETYYWKSVDSIEEVDGRVTIKDSSSSFTDFVNNNPTQKLLCVIYSYDTETQTTVEATNKIYSVLNSESTIVNMRQSSIPAEQLEDAQKLIADGIVQFFEIRLTDGTYLHLKADNSMSWNGSDWTGIPAIFEGYSTASGDSYSRPTLSVANPDGVYSTIIRDGLLDRAVVNRYLVLYDDAINDRPIYQKKTWIIWYVKSLNKQMIQVELRNPMDGVNFEVPARMYIPPEFPFVELN